MPQSQGAIEDSISSKTTPQRIVPPLWELLWAFFLYRLERLLYGDAPVLKTLIAVRYLKLNILWIFLAGIAAEMALYFTGISL